MNLLAVIFSAVALLGVTISLVGFLQKVPRSERIAVLALICVGGLLLVVIVLFASLSVSSTAATDELCTATNKNREAIAALVAAGEEKLSAHNLENAERLIDGPVC